MSELSYAYLHAVVSHAGASCHNASRTMDNNGIDATITGWGPFPRGGYRQEIDVKIQLKATTLQPIFHDGHFSYNLNGISRYDDLRNEAIATPRLLVVLYLPSTDATDWLTITENELMIKKCAYWVSLRGAASSTNATAQTVYIPQAQIFDTNNLKDIFAKLSRNEILNYQLP